MVRRPLAVPFFTLALVVLPLAAAAQEIRLGAELQVNVFTQGTERSPAVAMSTGGAFVVVWQGTMQDGAGSGIFGRRL